MHKIIIIGAGNIGKRHLQATSNLPISIDYEIICYDLFKDALESVNTFCKENNLKPRKLTLETNFPKIMSLVDNNSIVIIATPAKGRKDILEEVIIKKPLAIISEKPVCQKLEEYNSILKLNNKYNVPIYVNFTRHTFHDYIDICQELKGRTNIKISANDGEVGFACNGIHLIELATWLLNAKNFTILESSIAKIYETKRKSFYDFLGKANIKLDKNNYFKINIGDLTKELVITIEDDKRVFIINENKKKIWIKDKINNVSKTKNFTELYCSQITDKVILDIINNNKPKLPDINNVFIAHKILFEVMKKNNIDNLNFT